ncbi:MAG TPA: hemolysin family protein [Phototrophicaceae bacterium]|nr:hemolysin family protein [Phototrophicaceae bacterium]
MGDDSLSSLFVILILITLRGLLALAFGAISNVRQNLIREKAEAGQKAAERLLMLTDHNTRLQITHQFTGLMLDFAIASIAVLNLGEPVLKAFPQTSSLLVYTLVVLITACITLILGELVPEAIGSAYAMPLALWVIGPISLLYTLLRPVTGGLVMISKWISSIFRSSEKVNVVTEEEIMTMLESGHSGGAIEEEEKEMIFSVLQLSETYASEVMVPRIDLKALEIDTPLDDARAAFVESGFSRIPIYEDTIDNIKGLLYAKDLLTYTHTGNHDRVKRVRDLLRPAYFVPETKPVDELLKDLQSKRVHMAVVVDEYGGTAGIVTIENIIEEIIGDIRDEYDPEEEAEYAQVGENEYVVDAGIDIDDLNDLLDVELPNDDSDTLGGFIYTYFGRVPLVGEEIDYPDEHLKMRVESVEGRRIRKVHIIQLTQTIGDTGEIEKVGEKVPGADAEVETTEVEASVGVGSNESEREVTTETREQVSEEALQNTSKA